MDRTAVAMVACLNRGIFSTWCREAIRRLCTIMVGRSVSCGSERSKCILLSIFWPPLPLFGPLLIDLTGGVLMIPLMLACSSKRFCQCFKRYGSYRSMVSAGKARRAQASAEQIDRRACLSLDPFPHNTYE
jgi:hypothetical protein